MRRRRRRAVSAGGAADNEQPRQAAEVRRALRAGRVWVGPNYPNDLRERRQENAGGRW